MMKGYAIRTIAAGSLFSDTVYLDNQFILATPEIPISGELLKILDEWEFQEIYSDGTLGKEQGATRPEIPPELAGINEEQIKQAINFYRAFQKYVETLFNQVIEKNELDFRDVIAKVRTACKIIQENHRLLLRIEKNPQSEMADGMLAFHTVKCLIVTIVIGFHLKLPEHRLLELGAAALLHEIGMIKLPSRYYAHERVLSPDERKRILTHPILGYNLLKSFDVPLAISLAALEHHERENGFGYPQRLSADKISFYAKIIAVACSYAALTTDQPYKKAADSHSSIVALLKNEKNQYNGTVIKALVFSLSMYPVGLYVLLSDGRHGQVVDVDPEHPQFPIVQVVDGIVPDGPPLTLETSQTGVSIVRPLTKEEVGLVVRY
ncbi:MAG: HD domain-containing protein [Treponema sp.]|jgi:HD-GYP domain-containing protein (c-di-GMP phosphodiesterase class II)|nr:HD domain-containing protein [Treponema sp.]